MKILLVCAGGMSTGMLLKEMKKYWQEQKVDLEIYACAITNYRDYLDQYDIILLGPQVKYMLESIKEVSNLPCSIISAMDYAIANCESIMKLAQELYDSKG